MRQNNSFPNCLPVDRQIPVRIGAETVRVRIDVTDDLPKAASRIKRARLSVLFLELTSADTVEVRLNGRPLQSSNPLLPGSRASSLKSVRQIYDLRDILPRCGMNEIEMRLVEPNRRLREETPLEVTDLELEIDYDYPDAALTPPRDSER